MTNVPNLPPTGLRAAPDPDDPELLALRAVYPAWWIAPAEFGGFRAQWKSESGVTIRYVAGLSIPDLHHRLEVIESARAESA